MIDFNSPEWKEKIKGKSPEEIARIVEEYYEIKYKTEYPPFRWKGLVIIGIISVIFILFLLLSIKLLLILIKKNNF
jgi:hypothetical protein